MEIQRAGGVEPGLLGVLAAQLQAEPESFVAYLGDDAGSIAADIEAVAGWESRLVTAWEGDELVGWLIPEVDLDMGRAWWWGPFVAAARWDDVADRMYIEAKTTVGQILEEEFVADARSTAIPAFALRHGFRPEEGSALLRTAGDVRFERDRAVVACDQGHKAEVAALHDGLFPGTHTRGTALVEDSARSIFVKLMGGELAGYVSVEHQSDGSLYIEFLGVRSRLRGQGVGRALVESACSIEMAKGVAFAHLSVRESNTAARGLYRSLGFEEERVIVPYRKGFTLG